MMVVFKTLIKIVGRFHGIKTFLISPIPLETFRQFLEDEFDDRTYANNIIQGRAISDALARLADGINLLDKELHSQVGLPFCRFLRLIIMLTVVTEQGTKRSLELKKIVIAI